MRKRLAELPSPAMTVAFLALLAALTGTAVALPGNNTVTSGDIVNGQVKTHDIRNGTVRGRDIRNGTVTGRDVSERSLGTVPSARNAGFANVAGAAGRANSAATADTVRTSGVVTASDGATDVLVVQARGWRVELDCDLAGIGAILVLENTGAGNDSFVTDDEDFTDVDQGGEVEILSEIAADNPEGAGWQAIGGNRTLTTGNGAVLNQPATGFGGADCVGASTLIG
jgi:hypothetical protein